MVKAAMEAMTKGTIQLLAGVVGMIAVYDSLRPPSAVDDALMMRQGREFYLKEPVYLGLMAISGFISVLGLVSTVKGMNKGKD